MSDTSAAPPTNVRLCSMRFPPCRTLPALCKCSCIIPPAFARSPFQSGTIVAYILAILVIVGTSHITNQVHPLLVVVPLFTTVCGFGFFMTATFIDPGYIRLPDHQRPPEQQVTLPVATSVVEINNGIGESSASVQSQGQRGQGGNNDNELDRHCEKCNVKQPIGAFHCSECNRCVLELDHHCQFIGNCVGARNKIHFLGMVLFSNISIYSVIFSFVFTMIGINLPGKDSGREDSPFQMFVLAMSIICSIVLLCCVGLLATCLLLMFGCLQKSRCCMFPLRNCFGVPGPHRPFTLLETSLPRGRSLVPSCRGSWACSLPESQLRFSNYNRYDNGSGIGSDDSEAQRISHASD